MLNSNDARLRAGFTMIELMMALGAMFLVVGYTLSTFTFQHQTYVVVDQVSEAQQNTRALAALMERDIRNSGYLVEATAATCGVDNVGAADQFYVSDADAILPIDQLAATVASQTLGADVTATAGAPTVVTVDDVVLDENDSYDTNGDGTNDSDFRVNAGAILVDASNLDRGVACGVVTNVNIAFPQQVTVNFSNALGAGTPNLPDLKLIPAHVYTVTAGTPPVLRRDGDLLAKDVEDMQIAWFIDADDDNQVDANEYRGAGGTTYNPQTDDSTLLREIRINLVLRTKDDDPRNPTGAGTGQSLENRTAGSVAGDDGRRRRVHTATVRIRNNPAG